MCGIIGVVGSSHFNAAFNALRALEYRGYDSFGFGAIIDNDIKIIKHVGAISDRGTADFNNFLQTNASIGHTRWATHGRVNEINSHPHISQDQTIAIVHNGVIANFSEIKNHHKNWILESETDTEVASNLIAESIHSSNSIVNGLKEASLSLQGEFAICGIVNGSSDKIFAIKRKSPLIIAIHDEKFIVASDRTALSEFSTTMKIHYLEDNTIAYYNAGELQCFKYVNSIWQAFTPTFTEESLDSDKAVLGKYPHYMLKEIHETPSIAPIIRQELLASAYKDIVDAMVRSDNCITGSGSAFYVGMIGQVFFKDLADAYFSVHPSDEFMNIRSLSRRDLIIGISQSGETFDTLEIMREAQKNKSVTIAINNVKGCSMQRIVEYPIFQNSGKEICVLSTKSIISQCCALYLLATELGRRTGVLHSKEFASRIADYEKFPSVLEYVLSDVSSLIQKVAYQNCNIEHWFFIGRGAHYAVALESALKFKEVSYLHAEGMPAGFFKHGTISLIDEKFYTVVFLPSQIHNKELFQLTIDNVYEIRARGGKVIGFGNSISDELKAELFYEYIMLPDLNNNLNAISQLVAGQLFAYYSAVALNRNIDRPRALAKSVTVR